MIWAVAFATTATSAMEAFALPNSSATIAASSISATFKKPFAAIAFTASSVYSAVFSGTKDTGANSAAAKSAAAFWIKLFSLILKNPPYGNSI